VTAQTEQIAGSTAQADALRDWEAVRAAPDIQFTPLPPIKPPEIPEWLKTLSRWLEDFFGPLGEAVGMSWPTMRIILIASAILLAIFLLWRLVIEPLLERHRKPEAEAEPEWAPAREAAAALLEDADRLAAEGRFGEAAHLLLRRSVAHIAEAKPNWLHPASTAREIAGFPMLSGRARGAFGVIANRVERSLYALRELDAADWKAAREAYSDFAFAELAA
jgi:hypothetical protein